MFIVVHSASLLRIFYRQWIQLNCLWSVSFWRRRFLKFKSGRGEWTHCSSTPSLLVFLVPTLYRCLRFLFFDIVCREKLQRKPEHPLKFWKSEPLCLATSPFAWLHTNSYQVQVAVIWRYLATTWPAFSGKIASNQSPSNLSQKLNFHSTLMERDVFLI
jgi:hypothetical protein